jgi:hypothetical protein
MRQIAHAQIGGGYSDGPAIIIDASELAPGSIEVAAMYEDVDEIEMQTATNDDDARRIFSDMLFRYAEPLQKAFLGAGMVPGGRYTIFCLSDFGFPVVYKITFDHMEPTTYAQHRDVMKLVFRPFRKRKLYEIYFHSKSFIVCAGWRDINESNTKDTLTDTPEIKTTMSKYPSFDARYIDDAEHYLKSILVVHKAYKTGVNGKLFA